MANISIEPARVRIFLAAGDHAAELHELAVLAIHHLAAGAVGLGAQGLADALERVIGDEQADRLLLAGQQLRALELVDRDRRVRRRGERRGAAVGRAEVEDRALADLGVELGLGARALRGLQHLEHPAARGAGGAEGAAHDQRLDRLLVDRAAVDALAEVPQAA